MLLIMVMIGRNGRHALTDTDRHCEVDIGSDFVSVLSFVSFDAHFDFDFDFSSIFGPIFGSI